MLNAGYPAIRFTVAVENYNHQHQDLRVENGIEYGDTVDKMDFPYLARVTQLNIAALAALARSPSVPAPSVEGAVSTDTTLKWEPARGAAAYIVRWRPTNASDWQHSVRVPGSATGHVLRGVRVDDFVFGVSAVSAEGVESPVASAVPGGAFRPYTPPAPAPQQ